MIGSFQQKVKHSVTGKYYSETIQVDTLSAPINIRGKSSNGTWVVEYSGVALHCLGKVYFWRKKEALEWIKEVTTHHEQKRNGHNAATQTK